MEKSRFSLLLLEPSEIYLEDFSCIFIPSDITRKSFDQKKQEGRLKMCSRSLVFEPKDFLKPLIKIPLRECIVIEEWKGSTKFIETRNALNINCREYIEMLEDNIIAPYKFKESANFLFLLNYTNIANCLSMISQLQRASTLPSVEQSQMIDAIVRSRHSRVTFDHLWLDLGETVVMESKADRICPLNINPGRCVLSTMKVYFQFFNNIEIFPVIKIHLRSIKRIVKRRFLLRHIGLEIYASESNNTSSHIYLSFKNQNERDTFYVKLLEQPELQLDNLEQEVITLQWQNGIISNYEYLQYINSLGDRTVNDLTQYPVFPWIISNYSTSRLDLEDVQNYRDLTKPIGALNPDRLEKLLERYNEMPPPKFIYGSHYSTPGFVLYYLARQYPQYVLCLQGGRFDHPDRMFNSLVHAYRNCINNMSDFKELIPEFYDTSQEGKFLLNFMGIDFGMRFNGLKVGDVELPAWAESPKHLVDTLRAALESDIVSNQLHNWIDLIFGYQQRGDEAVKANNLFYHLCYEGSVDLDAIKNSNDRHALETQIMEFGQIPKQVFAVPHPKRKIGLPLLTEPYQIESAPPLLDDKWRFVKDLNLMKSFDSHKNTVRHLFISEDGTKITSVGDDSRLKVFCVTQRRQIRSANIGNIPLSSCLKLPNSNNFVIGSWDNQLLLYDLDCGRVTTDILAHEDAVTCLAYGKICNFLLSGSGDCCVKIWTVIDGNNWQLNKHLDHNSAVNCIRFDPEDKYFAVGTEDGEIYIWQTKDFTLYKKYNNISSKINALDYSPDGQKLVTGANNGVFQVLDVSTGMPTFSKTMKSQVLSLRWIQRLLAIGCHDGLLSIWDMFEVRKLIEIQAHTGPVHTVDIATDRSFIATGGKDKTVKVWAPNCCVNEEEAL